jgi:mannose/fructose/N-acetylgalactosamine-specific phosphotransferase system component IIB
MFLGVHDAAEKLATLSRDSRPGIVLTADVKTMSRLHEESPTFTEVNLGGLHTGPGRVACLRYVYLSAEEEGQLAALAARGVRITAQDLPVSRPTPLQEILDRRRAS